MKLMLSAIIALSASGSFAANLSCNELKSAYKKDLMNEGKYTCGSDRACQARQLSQLKATVRHYTEEDPSERTLKELKEEYEPIFSKIYVGDVTFEVVNIDLGDNSFLLFFDEGTTESADIAVVDGSIESNGKFCDDVAFEPVLNASRVHALCRSIVPLVRKQLPRSKFDHLVCTNDRPVDEATGNRTDFGVTKFDRREISVRVARNLHDVAGGYFSCGATMSRKTNVVSELNCDIK